MQDVPILEVVPVLQPWEVNRYGLIDWYDMLEFSARMFFWCGSTLRTIRNDCVLGSMPQELADTPIFNVARDLDETARTKSVKALKHVEEQFRDVGLQITADTVRDVIDELEEVPVSRNFQWLGDQVRGIEKLAVKELKGKAFFYVPAERIKFFPKMKDPHIFGKSVGDAFPSATYDIAESGVCLALARGTACVFHLMRVLEIGLAALGKVFGVSTEHTNWEVVLNQIESRIAGMRSDPAWKSLPDCKEQQEYYSQAASYLRTVKDAWRNYTMHVRGFYTEENAERIFENVKGFMQKLAERPL